MERFVFGALILVFSGVSAFHALLFKRSPAAAFGWILMCVLFPGVGALLYWILGVNRIRARAVRRYPHPECIVCAADATGDPVASLPAGLRELARASELVTLQPLVGGNQVEPLVGGDQAFPAMLEAIDGARESVDLSTYLFQRDAVGRRFVGALASAHRRGVNVRVLVDGVGQWYSLPPVTLLLKRNDIPFARFLGPSWRNPGLHLNLRNHRKLLVVDGERCFTGGMNISAVHWKEDRSRQVGDLHFRIEGPVVAQLAATFHQDWAFANDLAVEEVEGRRALEVPRPPRGQAICRGIQDGPNEDLGRLLWVILGAISSAREHVGILTPYFVPNRELIAVLTVAALRGVKVQVILPLRSNLPVVAWATRAFLWEVLRFGVEVYYQPAPFDHSKMLVVDGSYSLIGSANIDPRSLRLNFELNVEVFDAGLAGRLREHFEQRRVAARQVTLEDMETRGLPSRVRDSLAKLLSPYL